MIVKDYSYYSSSDIRINRKKSSSKKAFFALIIFLVIILGLVIKSFLPLSGKSVLSAEIISPLADEQVSNLSPTITQPVLDSSNLEAAVSSSLKGTKGKYAVGIISLKNGEQYFLNEKEEFDSASLYKLWVMVSVYKKIEDGSLKSDQVLTQDIKTLNEKFSIDEEFAEKTEGTISLSINDALNLMITRSDNYSALLLTEKIRLSTVQSFLNEYGLDNSRVGNATDLPYTTAYDTSIFLYRLYNGEFANKENTKSMIDLLKKQVLNSKIPKYLPVNTPIAHKTGELGTKSHDAGIIFSPNGEYILVVLSDTQAPINANERISLISKSVYEYFNKAN